MISGTFDFAPADFLHYRIHGGGNRHLLFLHGFAASLHTWDDLIPLFPPDEFTLHRLDLKGHGGSTKLGRSDYSARHNSRMVAAYIRSWGIGPVTIIGHSYGGVVALLAALEQTVVSALILIGTPAFPQELPPFMRILQQPLIGPLLMSALPARYIARRGLESAFHRHERICGQHLSRYAAGYRSYSSAQSLARTVRQMIPPDFARIIGSYKKLTLPVLLIWGEHDRIVRISQGEKLHAELPDSKFVVIPDCGHNPHEERHEATYAVIRDFISDAPLHPGSAFVSGPDSSFEVSQHQKIERSNMTDDKLTRLLHRFATTARAHYQALEEMDEERANAHARMIAGLYRSICNTGESGRWALLELADNQDPVVAGMAAVYSIGYDSNRSLTALSRVALEPGLLGFRARVAIDRWESGEWRGPGEDEKK